jgi:hypothetical protein
LPSTGGTWIVFFFLVVGVEIFCFATVGFDVNVVDVVVTVVVVTSVLDVVGKTRFYL